MTAGLPRAIKRHHGPCLGWVLGSADRVCREGQHAQWAVSSQVSPGSQVSGAPEGRQMETKTRRAVSGQRAACGSSSRRGTSTVVLSSSRACSARPPSPQLLCGQSIATSFRRGLPCTDRLAPFPVCVIVQSCLLFVTLPKGRAHDSLTHLCLLSSEHNGWCTVTLG